MRSTHDIGTSGVHSGVDHICGLVEQAIGTTVDNGAVVVDEDQIGFLDQAESKTKRVNPERGPSIASALRERSSIPPQAWCPPTPRREEKIYILTDQQDLSA
jgi:hypothetical protein